MSDQSKTTTNRKRGLGALLALAGTRKSSLIWAGIFSALSSVLSLAPLIVIYLVLLQLAHTEQNTALAGLWPILGWGALAMGLRWLLQVSGGILAHLAAFNILFDLRLAVADKLRRVPMGWITARSAESINKILRDDVDRLELFIAHHLNDSAAALTLPLVSAIALFYLDWRMALVTLITVPLAVLVQLLLWKKVPEVMREYNEVNARLASQVVQYVQGIAVIKTYHRGTAIASTGSTVALPQLVAAYFDVIVRMVKLTVPAWSAFTVVIGANMLCILPFGGYWYLQGSLPLELFVLCLLLGLGITRPLFQLAFFGSLMRLIQDGYGRIQDLMEAPELADVAGTLAPADNSVEFVSAGFAYDEVNVLQDISFKMAAGSLTAIVGPSGAGKSTLAQLLVRFWDVQQGAVNIGGVDVRELPLANMHAQVAYVMQDVFLFYDTVLENIRLGREDISEEQVIAAAIAAQAHDFISRLPQGYRTVLGERGARLSGGEKQRLSIARALVKDAPIIVLDEATAFSDPINEAQLLQALGTLTRDKTVMVIAHRLSTIIDADQIVVLDAGCVVACGKHAQLLEDCVLYRQLWQLQNDSASWKIKTAPADEQLALADTAVKGAASCR
ncbi:ABC transporter ATP-binding protein [Undibacterium pigrum]|uniref:ATP-binding cassette subfamily B protein n=1 Tax=Undibacterium pigrum TaxID=401470 RepID=A0A318JE76_9BURK|nr:ABC transporter ATP-binding protein [Undibacterium pigrum]PXX46807.1 ATP-binding cassette subfamily B protein [Undibacterium pigrum]